MMGFYVIARSRRRRGNPKKNAESAMESSYVYILTNKLHTVLYVGVTTSLSRRMKEHAAGQSAFTRRYNVHKLIYVEEYRDIVEGLIGRVRLILDLGRNATAQQSDCRVACGSSQ